MNVAVRKTQQQIARPLKMLVPLIKQELEAGDHAGHDHYRRAGEMLNEAKGSGQVPYGSWGRWLKKNFELSHNTANLYMRWARDFEAAGHKVPYASLSEMRGKTERDREQREAKVEQQFRRTLREIARDDYAQERQTRADENDLHREMAVQLIDLGFKALATRLHPDRGGSREAMARLNHVRKELKAIAETRRFV